MEESKEIVLGHSVEDTTEMAPEGDPGGLVRLALEKNVDVEVLERVVALQERVSDRNARAEFFDALARFQEMAPEIHKAKTAQIVTKTGGKYSYTYAPLEEITRAIRPVLRDCGLSYAWTTEGADGGTLSVICILRHISGHEERSAFPVPTQTDAAMSGAQKHGAALTYGKRQSLTSVLGLTTADEDTDGADPPQAGKTISDTQLADLEALILEVKANRSRFLVYLGIERLEDLTAANLPSAIRALEEKRGKAQP